MDLFIKCENNTPTNHPVTMDNLKLVYTNIDVPNELPGEWKRFIRIIPGANNTVRYEHNGYAYNADHDYFYDDWVAVDITPSVEDTTIDDTTSIDDDI